MTIAVPELSLVLLMGATGAGKSSFARRHFRATEVLSSDACRGWVCDDETSLDASKDAFDVLHFIAAKRLSRGLLTVVDATNVQPESRAPLIALAKQHHVQVVAIVLDVPERVCHARNAHRPDRDFGPHVARNHIRALHRSLSHLEREGVRFVHILRGEEEISNAVVTREPLWNNRRHDNGPFDIIGDVHGCADELEELLTKLGYERESNWRHPQGRRVLFLGDLVDRGPRVADALEIAMTMLEHEAALCVPGNHEARLERFLRHGKGRITHGLQETLDDLEARGPEFRARVLAFTRGLVSHYVLDGGKLVVAHAGLPQGMQGRASGAVKNFALYGDVTGEKDEFGLPVRGDWAREYRGRAAVVYGHTPVGRIEWVNNTLNIDGGCVFGGKLIALRWPEREIVSVPARRTYAESPRPFLEEDRSIQHDVDDVLDYEDVSGKRVIEVGATRITIREENALAALEAMSRFAADPKWLVYLPPTMSPPATSQLAGTLEHPDEAFNYYREEGAESVILQEKHMGSRAVVVLCRDEDAARSRFGVESGTGIIVTRTGRRFFDDTEAEAALLQRLRGACEAANFWPEFQTAWAVFDCELMPWSAKARELLRLQYAPVGASARASLHASNAALSQAASRGLDVGALGERYSRRETQAKAYVEAYRRYCWDVAGVEDLRLAPFHLLASEGRTHFAQTHEWHMNVLHRVCGDEPVLLKTAWLRVEVNDEASRAAGLAWWENLTGRGGEGMVVKPLEFRAKGENGRLVQPAVKVRGREYLRIIYGPEYDAPEHLERLRQRGLGAKRSLALREFQLGLEGLRRFVEREPLRRVHECVFGVLALESEPVDPRL